MVEKILVSIVVVLLGAVALQALQLERMKGAVAAMERDLALDKAQAAEHAQAVERAIVVAVGEVAAAFEEELRNAKDRSDSVIADLRSGNLRLQDRWTACEADRVSDTPLPSTSVDAAPEDRATGAGRIVRAAADCDAQVRGLQDYVSELLERANKR